MSKFEKFWIGLILGAVLPLIGFLGGWWSTSQYLSNRWVFTIALLGCLPGLVLDAIFIKKWVARAYEMDLKLWMVIFVFYSICVFGFFMGVPIFNLVLAIPAGGVIGRHLANRQFSHEDEKRLIIRTNLFSTGVMAVICAASAFLALRDPTTAANLEGMLRLHFQVTQGMIVTLIGGGGAALLGLHAWLVAKTIRVARDGRLTR